MFIDENTDAVLECRLVAVPEPEIIWFDGPRQLKTEDNVIIINESDMHMYTSILKITKIKKSQEGTYKIVAKNREGESVLDIVIKVKTSEKEPPQILEALKSMTVREGDSVILKSQIVGNPKPTIQWLKNGKPDNKLSTSEDGDVYSLTLIQPNKNDTAEYTIKATNEVGTAECTALITIEGNHFKLSLFTIL